MQKMTPKKQEALAYLDNLIDGLPPELPTFFGIPITEFKDDNEALLKLCRLFADEWRRCEKSNEVFIMALKR